MVLNDTTNKKGLIQDTYFYLSNVTTDDYPTLDVKRNINKAYRVAVTTILKSMDSWDFQDTTATADLVANQQGYTFESAGDFNITDVLTIDRLEVSYDGTNWVRVARIDRDDYIDALSNTTTTVNNDFNQTAPVYSIESSTISLFPIPTSNVTAGLKLYYTQDVTDLSSDGDVPVIAPQFHPFLSISAAYDYAVARGLSQTPALRQEMEMLKRDMAIFYSDRSKDGNTTMSARFKNYN